MQPLNEQVKTDFYPATLEILWWRLTSIADVSASAFQNFGFVGLKAAASGESRSHIDSLIDVCPTTLVGI